MGFEPDYRHFVDVMRNRRPARLPIYEHLFCTEIMEHVLGTEFAGLVDGTAADVRAFFDHYCRFFREMTYDVVSYEVCITEILPEHGAIGGGRPGPIQNRSDFQRYPWDDLPRLFWEYAGAKFDALAAALPAGMKAVGGIGNGVFEISEDLVGLEYLPFMQVDDPELYAELFDKIGDLMLAIWSEFLPRYTDAFVACRFGDDLGFKSSLLTNPRTVREQIIPQYERLVGAIHAAGRPFLWHSCGCVFEVMDDVIAVGIDAKHSNEDAIAPFSRWIDDYGTRVGLLGGFDMDFLCQKTPEEIYTQALALGREYRRTARGYAFGSGNSIPDYVPPDNYLALLRAAHSIRQEEGTP